MKKLYALLLTATLPVWAQAQNPFTGDLDSTFATNGSKTYIDAMSSSEYFYDRAVDTVNQKMYFIGTTDQGGNFNAYVLCTDLNGVPDPNYGNNGAVILDPSLGGSENLFCGALQPDGKLVVGGYTQGAGADMLLIRLDQNGSPDATFNGNGFKTHNSAANNNDAIRDLAIDNNGYIIVAGFTSAAGNYDMVMGRFQDDGDVDGSFGTAGFSKLSLGNSESFYQVMQVAGGGYVAAGSSNEDLVVVKVDNVGAPDNSFSSDGYTTVAKANSNLTPNALIETADEKLLIGGTEDHTTDDENIFVIKLKKNGGFDADFGNNGKYYSDFDIMSGDTTITGNDLLILQDGRILVSGGYADPDGDKMSLVMLDSLGVPVTSFGTNGMRTYRSNPNKKESNAMMGMLSNGALLLMGQSTITIGNERDMMVVKLKAPEKPVGIAHLHTNNDWTLYPNPCRNNLNIKRPKGNNEAAYASIINAQGQVIAQINSTDMQSEIISLDRYMQNAAAGLYMLSVVAAGERFSMSFIKE